MPAADCRIEWSKGGMERKTSELWQQMEKIVGDLAATAKRDATQQMAGLQETVGVTDNALNTVGQAGSAKEILLTDPVLPPAMGPKIDTQPPQDEPKKE
jgi:hypothetical protein